MLFVAFSLCLPAPAPAKVDITKVAAGTTIVINLLEIKATVTKAKRVAKNVKKTTIKVVKKITKTKGI